MFLGLKESFVLSLSRDERSLHYPTHPGHGASHITLTQHWTFPSRESPPSLPPGKSVKRSWLGVYLMMHNNFPTIWKPENR